MVVRKTDTGGALNARIKNTLKGKRESRARKDLRQLVIGLLVIVAIALVVFLLFVRVF